MIPKRKEIKRRVQIKVQTDSYQATDLLVYFSLSHSIHRQFQNWVTIPTDTLSKRKQR